MRRRFPWQLFVMAYAEEQIARPSQDSTSQNPDVHNRAIIVKVIGNTTRLAMNTAHRMRKEQRRSSSWRTAPCPHCVDQFQPHRRLGHPGFTRPYGALRFKLGRIASISASDWGRLRSPAQLLKQGNGSRSRGNATAHHRVPGVQRCRISNPTHAHTDWP